MKKTCRICKEEKNIENFYKHKKGKDGHFNHCKQCAIKDSHERYFKNIDLNRGKARNYYYLVRKNNPNSLLQTRICNQRWRERHPEANKASHLVRNRIQYQTMEKPINCSICGEEKKLHGHHYDYSKPLEVIWCCPLCHKQLHREMKKAA